MGQGHGGLSEAPPASRYLDVAGVGKRFRDTVVIQGLDLAVGAGELISLLGPSGCGKTTLLRIIAGLLTADRGAIQLDGLDLTRLPAHRRNVGVVFQNYALFPHLTVADNVAFGLRARRRPAAEVEAAVAHALALVQLGEIELRHLLRNLGITAIFVTHDQDEALVMSDRVAVMNAGRIEQLGSPTEIYHRPATPFVLDFVGLSSRFHGEVVGVEGDEVVAHTALGPLRARGRAPVGARVLVAVRPERIGVGPGGEGSANRAQLTVRDAVFLGSKLLLHFDAPDGDRAVAELPAGTGAALSPGDVVAARWSAADTLVFQLGGPL